jgi:hypothetical protein
MIKHTAMQPWCPKDDDHDGDDDGGVQEEPSDDESCVWVSGDTGETDNGNEDERDADDEEDKPYVYVYSEPGDYDGSDGRIFYI